jgi:hypothetical protein
MNYGRRAFVRTGAQAAVAAAISTAIPHESAAAAPEDMPGLEYAMTVMANIDPALSMGKTPLGERRVITISGGTFEGPRLKGVIMPGGEDWQIVRPDGVTTLEARYWLRASDGAVIKVTNRAIIALTESNARYVRSAPEFEAPLGPHDWLNKALFVGTVSTDDPVKPKVVTLKFYKVT